MQRFATVKPLTNKASIFNLLAGQTENKSEDLLAYVKEISISDLIVELKEGQKEVVGLIEKASETIILSIIEKLAAAKAELAKEAHSWLVDVFLPGCIQKQTFTIIHYLIMVCSPYQIEKQAKMFIAMIHKNEKLSSQHRELLINEIQDRVLFATESSEFLLKQPDRCLELGRLFVKYQSENFNDAKNFFNALTEKKFSFNEKFSHTLDFLCLQLMLIYSKASVSHKNIAFENIFVAIENLKNPKLLDPAESRFVGEWLTQFGLPLPKDAIHNDERSFLEAVNKSNALFLASQNHLVLYAYGLQYLKRASDAKQNAGDAKSTSLLQASSFFESKQTIPSDKAAKEITDRIQKFEDMLWFRLSDAFKGLKLYVETTEEFKTANELAVIKLRCERLFPGSASQQILLDDMLRIIRAATNPGGLGSIISFFSPEDSYIGQLEKMDKAIEAIKEKMTKKHSYQA